MIKILVVDDHPIFRKGLVALIQDEYEGCEVSEAENGAQAIQQLSADHYDIAILDIDMPEKSGIEVLDHIKTKEIRIKPIILTMHNDEMFFNEALNRGAKGFLLKEDSSFEMQDCLTKVQKGGVFVSKKLLPYMQNRARFSEQLAKIQEGLESLTNAEYNTLKLVAQDKTSKEIAELLFVTEKSVENYRSRICKKLEISGGSNSLYKWCVQNKELIR